jgi:hypothetical protein
MLMARVKYDGVIEAVRYAPDGKIMLARVYERRGATFSDRVLLDRPALVEKLKKGLKFVTGQREALLASTFETAKSVQLLGESITTGNGGEHDLLEDVPLF